MRRTWAWRELLRSSPGTRDHNRALAPAESFGILAVVQIRATLSRNALPITLTDDSAIAAAAIIGDSSRPKVG